MRGILVCFVSGDDQMLNNRQGENNRGLCFSTAAGVSQITYFSELFPRSCKYT